MHNPTVEETIGFVADRHTGQKDKQGEPYIWHVLRVAMQLKDPEDQMVALLHDVVEDCGVTAEDLRARGYAEHIVADVLSVTKRPEEVQDYNAFIERIATTGTQRAIRVKLADLRDNGDPGRMVVPAEKDIQRMEKYNRAAERLRQVLRK